MKKINLSILSKNILTGIFAATLIFSYSSCAKKTAAVANSSTPSETAAVKTSAPSETAVPPENKGQVQIKRDASGNYVIQINLRELEELSAIEPTTKKAYIVWMDADKQTTQNLGQINSNSGWLSDKSKASFEATSVFKPTKVFITEENDATMQKPGIKVIWSTYKF